MRDKVAKQDSVYQWCSTHANGDGFVDAVGAHISSALGMAPRTVYGYLSRLEDEGKIYKLEYGRYAVVERVD